MLPVHVAVNMDLFDRPSATIAASLAQGQHSGSTCQDFYARIMLLNDP